jgi:glycosyltransferase involved in cell wall biosynthesis
MLQQDKNGEPRLVALKLNRPMDCIEREKMKPHIVCVGGEDHPLRIPYLLALQERRFRVTAVSTGDGSPFKSAGIAHHSYRFDRFSSGSNDWKLIGSFRKLMADLKPDIAHSFDTKPNLLVPIAVRRSAAVVRTINGLGWVFSSAEPRALALRPIYCALQWLVSRWTSATVFQNRDDQALFQRYGLLGSSQSILIGSSGIDADAFLFAQKHGHSPSQLRTELGLQDTEVIIYVGRLTRQKGIPTLLKAVPLVLAQRPSARFVLVGPLESEGPFAVSRALIDRLGHHVVTLGHRKDVAALLGMADVFAFPTEYREGIPRVLLEAGLAGLPIIASRMPGCSDVVEDGVNGYLVGPHDPKALATRIVDLLSDAKRAKAMGALSVPRVRQRFELTRVVDAYSKVYNTILGESRCLGTDAEFMSAAAGELRLADGPSGVQR